MAEDAVRNKIFEYKAVSEREKEQQEISLDSPFCGDTGLANSLQQYV